MAKYTKRQKQHIKDKVIECLSSGDLSLTELCEQDNMPSRITIYRWQAADPEFEKSCARAEKGGYDRLATRILAKFDDLEFSKLSTRCADKIMSLINGKLGHVLEPDHIKIIYDILLENAVDAKLANAEVQKVTNQFRSVMAFLSKRHPSKYGEKLQLDHQIDDKRSQTPEELEVRLTQLLEQRKKLVTQTKH